MVTSERQTLAHTTRRLSGVCLSLNLARCHSSYFLLDTSYVSIWERIGVQVEVGYEQDDFTKLLRTIRAYARVALTVYNKGAVLKGPVSTPAT